MPRPRRQKVNQPEQAPADQPEQAPADQPQRAPADQPEQAPADQPEQAPDQLKLGKKAARHDPRTLRLVSYVDPTTLAEIPAARDWGQAVSEWGMLGNQRAGNCTCATAGHQIQLWAANQAADASAVTEEACIDAYRRLTGYDPATGANDTGCVVMDVLNLWRQEGIAGNLLGAYAAVSPHDPGTIGRAINDFGSVYLGLRLPAAWRTALQRGQAWDAPSGPFAGWEWYPDTWGGHAVPAVAYDAGGVDVVTWGRRQRITWEGLSAYCDECYAIIDPEWLGKGTTPSGFNLEALAADLDRVTSGGPRGAHAPPDAAGPAGDQPANVVALVGIDADGHQVSFYPLATAGRKALGPLPPWAGLVIDILQAILPLLRQQQQQA